MPYDLDKFLDGEYGDPSDSVHVATCENCGAETNIESDGQGDCPSCGKPIQAPLVALGLI